jgi:hypothetical protein
MIISGSPEILNAPYNEHSLGSSLGYTDAEYAKLFKTASQEISIDQQYTNLINQERLISQQAAAETDVAKKQQLRDQELLLQKTADEALQHINMYANETIKADPNLSQNDKLNAIQANNDHVTATLDFQKASNNFVKIADSFAGKPASDQEDIAITNSGEKITSAYENVAQTGAIVDQVVSVLNTKVQNLLTKAADAKIKTNVDKVNTTDAKVIGKIDETLRQLPKEVVPNQQSNALPLIAAAAALYFGIGA